MSSLSGINVDVTKFQPVPHSKNIQKQYSSFLKGDLRMVQKFQVILEHIVAYHIIELFIAMICNNAMNSIYAAINVLNYVVNSIKLFHLVCPDV